MSNTFSSVSYPWHLYVGVDALRHLANEIRCAEAERVFVVCGQTVAHRTNLLKRIKDQLGLLYAGVFDAMDKDTSWSAVQRGTDEARLARADLLLAVGGGSVIVGARVMAILLAEKGHSYPQMNQYPDIQAAVSPSPIATKPPIINIVTTPTSAMNRAGAEVKNDALDHRMEFYDLETRPVALFWDAEALLTASPELIRSTGTTTFSESLRNLGVRYMNPLVEGNRLQAFRLAYRALPRVMAEPYNVNLRIDLCTAAFLANRSADDGADGPRESDPVSSNAYALATALHTRYHHIRQGEAYSAVTPVVTRLTLPRDADRGARIAAALGVLEKGMSAVTATATAADAMESFYRSIGMPTRIRELKICETDLPLLAQDAVKNLSADEREQPEERADEMLRLLRAAW